MLQTVYRLQIEQYKKTPALISAGVYRVKSQGYYMIIDLTLNQEEFEPVIVNLLSQSLNREVTTEQIKSVTINFVEGRPRTLSARIEVNS